MAKKTVFVLGVRGFPEVQGGVESHCEHLYPFISDQEYDVTVLVRRPYVPDNSHFGNIHLVSLWSPTTPGFEALLHTFIGVIYSIVKRPDLLHIHAIGPSFFVPLARIFGLKVVCTHHGFDYEREKWGSLTSWFLRISELLAAKWANELIAVSGLAANRLSVMYQRPVNAISNGVNVAIGQPSIDFIEELGLESQKYFLSVSRIVEEKRQLDIINAYLKLKNPKFKLVIVGDNGGSDEYFRLVCEKARKHANIVMAGFQSGENLDALFYYAGAFVHASSLEGNPIVLLEAMSYGLSIIASDIPPNRELELAEDDYFPLGQIDVLQQKMRTRMEQGRLKDGAKIERTVNNFSWRSKAEETMLVYKKVLYPAGDNVLMVTDKKQHDRR